MEIISKDSKKLGSRGWILAVLLLATSPSSAAAESRTTAPSFGRHETDDWVVPDDCKYSYNRTFFDFLINVCDDCAVVESFISKKCRHECFTTGFFKGCLENLSTYSTERIQQITAEIKLRGSNSSSGANAVKDQASPASDESTGNLPDECRNAYNGTFLDGLVRICDRCKSFGDTLSSSCRDKCFTTNRFKECLDTQGLEHKERLLDSIKPYKKTTSDNDPNVPIPITNHPIPPSREETTRKLTDVPSECRNSYNETFFKGLMRLCDECLGKEPFITKICKSDCFTTKWFRGCLGIQVPAEGHQNILNSIKPFNKTDATESSNQWLLTVKKPIYNQSVENDISITSVVSEECRNNCNQTFVKRLTDVCKECSHQIFGQPMKSPPPSPTLLQPGK